MDLHKRDSQFTETEVKLLLNGAVVYIVLFLSTFLFGRFVSPLELLQLRLFIVGTGAIYYLAIYFYYNVRSIKKPNHFFQEKTDEIIVYFNGRELGRW